MLRWLAALIASSFTFALADVICDICITETEDDERAQTVETAADDDDSETGVEMGTVSASEQYEPQQTPLPPRYKALTEGKQLSDSDEVVPEHEEKGLSGAQDAAIAGLINTLGVVVSVVWWLLQSGRGGGAGELNLRWRPSTHYQWWFAMAGGGMNFMHYFFFLKAFEGAPSTVLLPLVQVASVSVFFGSSVIAIIRQEPWITPTHALAYVIMFVGGILPACAGNLSTLLERSFWRQSFVAFAIAAEFSLGLHDLMLSGCAYKAPDRALQPATAKADGSGSAAAAAAGGGSGGGGGEDSTPESFEFFVWSRFSFIATFASLYLASPQLYAELRDLLSGRIENKYVALSAFSEGLTIVGFYLASIAYGLFYQAGIVHAAEASLSQLFNLMLAYVLLRGCGIGRSSAVSSLNIKFVSFIMVTIGLFLCTFEPERPPARPAALPGVPPAGLQLASSSAAVPSAVPYVSQTDLLLGAGVLPLEQAPQGVTPMAATVAATTAARMLRRRTRRRL